MQNSSNIKPCILMHMQVIIYASILYEIGNEAIIVKKEYNSPALEIYELKENVMEDPISTRVDPFPGDSGNFDENNL